MKRLFYYMTLLAAVLLTACTNDEAVDTEQPLPEGMGCIRLTICSPENAGGSTSRAVNATPWEDPDHEWERLQTFRILICKASNNEVVQIITGDKSQLTAATTLPSTYKSATVTSQPLEAGSYYVYATANFADGYSVGDTFDPNVTVKFTNGYSATSAVYFGDKKNIPMTGKLTSTPGGNDLREVGVANGIPTDVTDTPLTLWRVMGKMQFYFTNESTSKIRIKGVEVEPLNLASVNGPGIYLFSKDVLTSTNNLAAQWVTEPVSVTGATATWALHDAAMQPRASVSPAGLFAQAQLMWGAKLESSGQITAQDADATKLQKFKAKEKVNTQDEGAAIILQVKPMNGLTFTPTTLSFTACRGGTGGGNFDVVAVSNSTNTILATGEHPMRYNGQGDTNPTYVSKYEYNISGLSTTGVFYVKIYVYNLDATREYAFSDFVITGNVRNTEGVTTESVTLPGGARDDVGAFSFTPADALELDATNGTGTLFFYVNESDGTYTAIENQLSLRFKIQRQNGSGWYDDEIRYGVTTHHDLTNSGTYGGYSGGFNVIRRNDWIHIPVVLTDWQFRIEPLAFVPIAGYPASVVSNDGLTATFSTGGFIILQPFVKKYSDATWLDFSDPNVTFVSVAWTNSDGNTVSGNDKIVKTAFTYDSANHCLVGELNNNLTSGPHKTTLTINVKLGPTGSQYDYSFTCNVVLQK